MGLTFCKEGCHGVPVSGIAAGSFVITDGHAPILLDLAKKFSIRQRHLPASLWQECRFLRFALGGRILAEIGASQHGAAAATVCARFGLECSIYMGTRHGAPGVERVPHGFVGCPAWVRSTAICKTWAGPNP
ncbi:MAG: hypothetical protein TE42_06635 [Candidatus Synechococcus spongiarum SP3]|uniref:Uncharacterized protein n=1 Tax=Candidatus Synechococcus spongiarum SP3 TaxID=1604020 RepID=A0A0G2HKE1_9SYNE|nr:MAG: hypothetical protein TE42_06635 [Candidatus Synechococcus spongiarum SP3]